MVNQSEKFVEPKSGEVFEVYMELSRVAEKRWKVTESETQWSSSGNAAIEDLIKHFGFMSAIYKKSAPVLCYEAEKYDMLAKDTDNHPEVTCHLKYMAKLCREIASTKPSGRSI